MSEPMHFLKLDKIWSEGQASWTIECRAETIEEKEKAGCVCWVERAEGCVCVCGPCAEGDHGDCTKDSWYIEGIGWSCAARKTNDCGVVIGLQDIGSELIAEFTTTEVEQYPIPCDIEWDDGYPIIKPWKESVDA